MSLEIVTLDRIAPQPWRNGGGSTRELLSWPAPTPSANVWRVRISVAEVLRDGAFSAYPGVQRWFAVIDGAGVLLQFAAGRERLDAQSAPLQFDGALAPHCELLGGPTVDLNLMSHRQSTRSTMSRVDGDAQWFSTAPMRALFAAEAMRLQIDDADAALLPAGTLVWSDHAARQRWRVIDNPAPRAWWMSWEAAA